MTTEDFPVANIICSACESNLMFSQKQSTNTTAIFYCNEQLCPMFGFFVYIDESIHQVCVVEIEHDIRKDV